MRGKPVANFIFALDLHASYICIGLTREANLLQILYSHWIYTRGKPVANFMFALGLHARQNCCKCLYILAMVFAIGLHYTASRRIRDFRMPLRICKLEVYTGGKSGKSICKFGFCYMICFKFEKAQTHFFAP